VAENSIEPLVTECPNCGTRFRVTEGQLEIADGKVRCGSCLEVFLGAEHFVLDEDEADLGGDANEALDALLSELAGDSTDVFGVPRESPPVVDDETEHVPDADDELTSGAIESDEPDSSAGLESIELVEPPELPDDEVGEFADFSVEDIEFIGSGGAVDAPLDLDDANQTDEGEAPGEAESAEPAPGLEVETDAEPDSESAIDPEHVEEIVLDEGESPHPFGWNREVVSGAAAEHQPVPEGLDPVAALGPLNVDIEPADLEPATPLRKRHWIPVATVVATLALVAQVFWSQQDEWSADPSIRPIYEFGCRLFFCELAPLRAVDAIYSKNLVVREHPDVEDALMIDALVINGAPFEQPYPVIELRFSSIDGRTVAGRRFQPAEYLAGEAAGAKMIGPNTPVHISLSIKDPGADAVNYVMLFH